MSAGLDDSTKATSGITVCREKHSGDVEISMKQAPGIFPLNIHVNIPYLTGFHSVKCLPLQMSSLKCHEDVTADSGIILDIIRPKWASRQRDSR